MTDPQQSEPHTPPSTEPPRIRWCTRRNPCPAISIAVMVIALLGAGAWIAYAIAEMVIAALQMAGAQTP